MGITSNTLIAQKNAKRVYIYCVISDIKKSEPFLMLKRFGFLFGARDGT